MHLSDLFQTFDQSPDSLGKQWVASLEECAMSAWGELDFDQVPKFGISNRHVVSYLDTSESTKKNMFDNEIALIGAENGSFKAYNNIERLMTQSLQKQCGDDVLCKAYFGLCFNMSSNIFHCNDGKPSLQGTFVPIQDQIVSELLLVGSAFHLDVDQCFLATPILNRIDGQSKLYLNEENSKRISAQYSLLGLFQ